MNKIKMPVFLFLLLNISVMLPAQAVPIVPEQKERPQWVKDLRRWEIVTFGSIPFAMFFTTFSVDMFRWSNNNWDTRFAPWPLKSAGAVPMTSNEMEKTITIAAGVSITIGLADLLITQSKRRRDHRRAQALPVGSITITRTPWDEDSDEHDIDEESDLPELSPEAP